MLTWVGFSFYSKSRHFVIIVVISVCKSNSVRVTAIDLPFLCILSLFGGYYERYEALTLNTETKMLKEELQGSIAVALK